MKVLALAGISRASGRNAAPPRRQRRAAISAAVALWLLCCGVGRCDATAVAVATSSDLAAAVSNAAVDTITVTAGIAVTSQLLVTRTLLVQGNAALCAAAAGAPPPVAGLCALSGGGSSRIFKVYSPSSAVTLTLNALALVNGSDAADGLGGGAVLMLPGATVAASPGLVATGCVFQNNAATGTGPGGAVAANPAALQAVSMAMTLTDSTFVHNSALSAAGAVLAAGRTVLTNVSFAANCASYSPSQLTNTSVQVSGSLGLGFAGALQLASCTGVAAPGSSLSVTGGSFVGNWATQGGAVVCGPGCSCSLGGGVSFLNNSAAGTFLVGGACVAGSGGAVAALPNATLTVAGASFVDNTASCEGGAVFMSGTKQGSVANALGGIYGFQRASPVLTFTAGTAVAVSAAPVAGSFAGTTWQANVAGLNGGSIYIEGGEGVLNVSNCSITGGAALTKKGGAIYSSSSSTVSVANTSIAGTSAGLAGGAIAVGASSNVTLSCSVVAGCSVAGAGVGGGVFLDANTSTAAASLAFSNNSAAEGGALFVSGGGVLVASGLSLFGNAASSGGGAIYAAAAANLTLQACNFTANAAANSGGALLASSAAGVSLSASAFIGNAAAGLAPHGGAVSLENVAAVSIAGCVFQANSVTTSTAFSPVGALVPLVYAGANTAGALFLGAAPAAQGGLPMFAAITDTAFANCSASGDGGALAALGQASVITLSLSGVAAFTGNRAGGSGGAMVLQGAVAASLAGVAFVGNAAAQDGGAAAVYDGVRAAFAGATAFTGNAAGGAGGALFLRGVAGAATNVTGGAFAQNAAQYGGAVGVSGAGHAVSLTGAALSGNSATYGGAFALADVATAANTQLALSNLTLRNSTAAIGALFFTDALVDVPACAGCALASNAASNYGAGIASLPYNFSVRVAGGSVGSGAAPTLVIGMQDAYGSAVTSWPGFAAAVQPAAALSGVLSAVSFAGGSSTISTATVKGVPLSTVQLAVVVTSPALPGSAAPATVGVLLAPCGPNQVFGADTLLCQCDRGYFMPVGSAAGCQPCPAGTFAGGIGEVACTACAATDVSRAASVQCGICPPFSRPVADDLCMCEANWFGTFAALNKGICSACPANAVCQGGAVVAAPGYWKATAASTEPQPCPEADACDFGNRTAMLLNLTLSGADDAAIRAASCSPGYEGPLCALCAAGYGRDTDMVCGQCPSFALNTGKLALSSASSVFSVVMTIKSTMSAGLHGGNRPPLHAQVIKIFLNYLTVTSLASRAPLRWPKRIEELLAAQATGTHSGGKVVSIDCSLPDRGRPKFYDVLTGYLVLVPVAAVLVPVVACMAIYHAVALPAATRNVADVRFKAWWAEVQRGGLLTAFPELSVPMKCAEKAPAFAFIDSQQPPKSRPRKRARAPAPPQLSKEDEKYEAHLDRLAQPPELWHNEQSARQNMRHFAVISFVCIVYFLWTPVTSVVLSLFLCVELDAATPSSPFHGRWLLHHVQERCWTGRHLSYVLSGGVAGLAVVMLGVPVCTGVFLFRNRMRIEERDFRLRYGFLYYGYRRDACFYESVINMRKLAMVAVTIFFSHSVPSSGAYVLCIMLGVMFVSSAVHVVTRPYSEPVLARLEILSVAGSVMTLWLGLFFYLGTPPAVEIALTIVIVVANALLCVEFGLTIVSELLLARLGGVPAGAEGSPANADLVSSHVTFYWWAKAAAMKRGPLRSAYKHAILRFISWLEHGRRSLSAIRADIPTTLRSMQAGVRQQEYTRRSAAAARWVEAGLVADDDVAAWLCAYEGRGRAAASLAPLISATCARARAEVPYLRAAQQGRAAEYEKTYEKKSKRGSAETPPPPGCGGKAVRPPTDGCAAVKGGKRRISFAGIALDWARAPREAVVVGLSQVDVGGVPQTEAPA